MYTSVYTAYTAGLYYWLDPSYWQEFTNVIQVYFHIYIDGTLFAYI